MKIEFKNSDIGFEKLNPYLGLGAPVPIGWQRISEKPLLIFVGGMGVGKSTTIAALVDHGAAFTLLPDRRFLTDRLMVAPLQREDDHEIQTLGRIQRLPYIQRYKQRYPAGIAHAISRLWVDPAHCESVLLFDGLRGEAEVRFVIENLERVQFVALFAPDPVRLHRLLNRNDAYDQIASNAALKYTGEANNQSGLFEALGMPDAPHMFSEDLTKEIEKLVRQNHVPFSELRDKIRILFEEHKMYDVNATVDLLKVLVPQQTLFIDTSAQNPEQVAAAIKNRFGL